MDTHNVQREEIESVYGKISPFEFRNRLISLAQGQKEKSARVLLDAGRGNPNWIAATPREAFFTFGLFAVEEARKVWNDNDLAGMPLAQGIYERFIFYADNHKDSPGIELLMNIINYGIKVRGFDPDGWVHELADGIIGDNYPVPDRMLVHIEKVVRDYLTQEFCYNKTSSQLVNLFAVEGATAAMCYIFDSLIANELLSRGDKIAVMTPIFTPYLEIPLLPRYDFKVVEINANEVTEKFIHTWQYPESELQKLDDPSIKALFVVNPSNPPSVAMKPESIKYMKEIIEKYNKNLMIVSDDVYGTFVENFCSLASELPYNTLGVYSFSKYFGVTGWRLGTIALQETNVFDKLLKELPEEKKKELGQRYAALSTNPEDIPFIDRIVADSRQVAMHHTAGLSTPQQVQMAFFCVFALLDRENKYKKQTMDICRKRKKLFFEGLGLELHSSLYDAAYYAEFDLIEWANYYYENEFAEYLQKNYKPVDILYSLAEESSIVLLSGGGFHGPEWSIRISLANLNDSAYSDIGKYLHQILEKYVEVWKESTK